MTLTNYTREIAATICTRMSEGESVRAICRDPGMPSEGTVRGWAVRDVDGFTERYRAARFLLMEYWSDEIVAIADDGELDPRDRQIRTSVRQWIMSKIAPRRYGDKMQIGGDPESPLLIMHPGRHDRARPVPAIAAHSAAAREFTAGRLPRFSLDPNPGFQRCDNRVSPIVNEPLPTPKSS